MLSDSKSIVNPNPNPYREQCEGLHNRLIEAMKESVDVLSVSSESESKGPDFFRRFLSIVSGKEAFCKALDPKSREYNNNITFYVSHRLADQSENPQHFEYIFSDQFPSEKDETETADLFKSPQNAMNKAYHELGYFGLKLGQECFNF